MLGVSKKTHDQLFSSTDLIAQVIYMLDNYLVSRFKPETQTISEKYQGAEKLSSKDFLKVEFDHQNSERVEKKYHYFGYHSE